MKNKAQFAGKKVLVTQTRSAIGRSEKFRQSLRALGLGRIGLSKHHTVNPAVLGMLEAVSHVVEVRESK